MKQELTTAPLGVEKMTVAELVTAYGAILDELRRREIVRRSNSPLSDYAEFLFCRRSDGRVKATQQQGTTRQTPKDSGIRSKVGG